MSISKSHNFQTSTNFIQNISPRKLKRSPPNSKNYSCSKKSNSKSNKKTIF